MSPLTRPKFDSVQTDPTDKKRMSIGLVDASSELANALRRSLINHVNSVALDPEAPNSYTIIHNSSRLNNEELISRISLVPIHVDDTLIRHWQQFGPYVFKIDVSSTSMDPRSITTKDIQVLDAATNASVSSDIRNRLFPPNDITNDHILLMELFPQDPPERIHLTFKARCGCGIEHARWNPVSEWAYVNRIDASKYDAALKERLAGVAEADKLQIEAQFRVCDGQRCFIVDANGDACAFDFTIYSEVGRSPISLFGDAITALRSHIVSFQKELNDLLRQQKASRASLVMDADRNEYSISVEDEDFTLGCIVQRQLFDHWILKDQGKVVTFVGCRLPHPLQRVIEFKFKSANPMHTEAFLKLLIETYKQHVVDFIQDVEASWTQAIVSRQ